MVKHKLTLSLLLILSLSCVEQATNTATKISNQSSLTNTANILDDYAQSSFSKYIYQHKTQENLKLIDYNFFSVHDLCQQATYDPIDNPNGCKTDKTIELACEFQSMSGTEPVDYLSINISAPITGETECENKIVLDLSEAQFTAEGLIFTTPVIDIFASDFEFQITKDGFVDTKTGELMTFETNEVDLPVVYNQIVANRLADQD